MSDSLRVKVERPLASQRSGKFDPSLVYQRLGEFVVVFQWFEDKLLDVISRLHAGERFWDARGRFVKTSFAEKIERARELSSRRMLQAVIDGVPGAAEWATQFPTLLDRCDALRSKRNTLIHSSYVHLEAGNEVLGIVRSKLGREDGVVTFDQGDPLSDLDTALQEAAQLAVDLGIAQMQIVRWQALWGDPVDPDGPD